VCVQSWTWIFSIHRATPLSSREILHRVDRKRNCQCRRGNVQLFFVAERSSLRYRVISSSLALSPLAAPSRLRKACSLLSDFAHVLEHFFSVPGGHLFDLCLLQNRLETSCVFPAPPSPHTTSFFVHSSPGYIELGFHLLGLAYDMFLLSRE
jgi:hypothetical protein